MCPIPLRAHAPTREPGGGLPEAKRERTMNLTSSVRARLTTLAAAVLLSGSLVAAASTTATPQAEEHDHSSHDHGQGRPENKPEKGLVYDGLEQDDTGRCKKAFKVKDTDRCTHGPDAAPEGVDVAGNPTPATGPSSAKTLN